MKNLIINSNGKLIDNISVFTNIVSLLGNFINNVNLQASCLLISEYDYNDIVKWNSSSIKDDI